MEIKVGNYTLQISQEVLKILDHYTQRKPNMPESGGVILGRVLGDNIRLERLSIPTELDKASRTNFERHRLSAQIVINHEYFNSNGQVVYLGEWHTHPEDYPTPSGTDLKMINQQFKTNKIHIDFLILLIQGRKKMFVSITTKDGITVK